LRPKEKVSTQQGGSTSAGCLRPKRKRKEKQRTPKNTESERPRVKQVHLASSIPASQPNAARPPLMASSEIEEVEDTAPICPTREGEAASVAAAGATGEGEALKDDVYTGGAYGDLEKLSASSSARAAP
jgi:hypothetical protein